MIFAKEQGSCVEHPLLTVSAPCRIDLGGTLDITTFYYPLRRFKPCTFNVATRMRTVVRFYPFTEGKIKISSHGFDAVEFGLDDAVFHHPLGLMSAIAVYFEAQGLHIHIHSESPPRSALGGSSSAAVAMIAGMLRRFEARDGVAISKERIALLAHALESVVAGVPCGMQDQLAAVYGGVNAWYWNADGMGLPFRRQVIDVDATFESRILLAYCGEPHVSANINGKWVGQFLDGHYHREWRDIVVCARCFVEAVAAGDFETAVTMMNKEIRIRKMMTPDVFDDMGNQLVDCALENRCGARFAGAGGGGCVWALGEPQAVRRLRPLWEKLLKRKKDACLLDFAVDHDGVVIHENENETGLTAS